MLKFPQAKVTPNTIKNMQRSSSSGSKRLPSLDQGAYKPKRPKVNAFADRLESFSKTGSALKQRIDSDGSIMGKFTTEQKSYLVKKLFELCGEEGCLFILMRERWVSIRGGFIEGFNKKFNTKFRSDDITIFYLNALTLGRNAFKSSDLTKLDLKVSIDESEESIQRDMIRLYLDYEKNNISNELLSSSAIKKWEGNFNLGNRNPLGSVCEWYWNTYHTDEDFYLINNSWLYLAKKMSQMYKMELKLATLVKELVKSCPSACNPKQIYNPLRIKRPAKRAPTSTFEFSIEACEKAIREANFLASYTTWKKQLKLSSPKPVEREFILRKSVKDLKDKIYR